MNCRICGDEEPHNCRYAHATPMSPGDETELLQLLRAAPREHWTTVEPEFSVDEFKLGDWSVFVFFDGCEVEDWDYIDHVIAPDGRSYASWPGATEQYALPQSIVYWTPLSA
ncbi:MAG: hypothetical protein HOV81_25510 [Kofleriaceae bacterium]|nr:hypothetical protein [Kofleriaceae bacterium]